MRRVADPRWAVAAAVALLVVSCTGEPVRPSGVAIESAGLRVRAIDSDAGRAFTPVAAIGVDGQDLPPVDPASLIDPIGDGTAVCPNGTSLAVAGPLSGDGATYGNPVLFGVTLAVHQFRAANPGCQLSVKQFDTHAEPDARADPEQARQAGIAIASDASIVGLVGPVLSRDMLIMGDTLAAAGIIAASPSATMPALSSAGWHNFFRGVANEEDWPTASAMFLTRRLAVQKVCVVNLDYDEFLLAGRQVTDLLGPVADPACSATIGPDANSFEPVVESIRTASPDVVYLAADMFAAGEVCSVLRKSGVTAKIFGSDGVQARQFIKQAGAAAIGVLVAGTFQLPTERFSAAYQEEFGETPWHYSVEAYELAGIMIEGISTGAVTDRSSMLRWFTGYSGYGAITHYQWANSGELVTPPVFLTEVS